MYFIHLGFTNAWRNLGRSVLAILSFAFAAGFLTYAISLGRGYAFNTAAIFRSQLGGELILYSRPIEPSIGGGDRNFRFQDLPFWEAVLVLWSFAYRQL
jgi:ABC-type antimicrobial peptide transport system permease subunit